MNKYEALFDEIFKQTKTGKIRWKQVRRGSNSDLIFNPNLVFRQFASTFERAGGKFKLFLLEKKFDDPDHDFVYEKYLPELLIVDEDDELVTTLTDSLIERADMIRLANMVETKSDKASKLFGSDT